MDLFLYFFKAYPRRSILVFIAVTIASIITAATLLILPALLFSLVGRNSAKTQFVNDFLVYLGISPNVENLVTLFLIGITFQASLLAGANIYAGFIKAKVIKDLRIKLIKNMSQTEWKFFTRQPSGYFTVSLVNEIESAGDGYEKVVHILSNSVQMIAYLSVAFFLSWQIAIIAVIVGIILSLLFGRLISMSKNLGNEKTKLTRRITSKVADSYRSIKPLKAMARESNSHALLSSYTKQLKNVTKKDTIAAETLGGVQEILLMFTVILTIYFAFEHLDIPIEYSIILIILYLRTMRLFGKSYKQYQSYVGNISAFEKLIKTMNKVTRHREQREGTIKHKLNGDIIFKDVCFNHGNKPILVNASFTFYHKKLNSIIGPSGKGKTTLVDLICGLYLPDSGEILIDGIPLNTIDIAYWRRQIGYVTQENNLLNTTIKDNITLGDSNFTLSQVESALEKAHCDEFINELPGGIMYEVGENGAHLSGGQRQRILIARALVHSPRLLILDEATSALDSETEKSLSKIFKDLSRMITVVSISHRPALMEISDNIINLKQSDFNQKIKSI